jgi:uncharacterized protein (TIRG00374 family)
MKKIQFFIQLLISLLCFFVLTRIVHLDEIKEALGRAVLAPFFAVFILIAPAVFIRAWRWHFILSRKKVKVSLGAIYRVTFIGMALNLFLPGGAGDVARSYYGWQSQGYKEAMLASAVADKAVALFALCLLGVICGFSIKAYEVSWITLLFALPLGLILFVPWRHPWKLTATVFRRVLKKELDVDKLLNTFRMDSWTMFVSVLASLLGWVVTNSMYYLAALTFSPNSDIWYIFATAPLINLMRIVPITVSGLGSADALIVFLFDAMRVSKSEAMAASMTINLALIAIPGLVGAILLLSHRNRQVPSIKEPFTS